MTTTPRATAERMSAKIESLSTAPLVSGAETMVAGDLVTAGVEVLLEAAGRWASGCVWPIFSVAFGRAGLAVPSGGRVMRAVSFFGAAALPATPPAAGAGRRGTVG